MMQYRYDVAVTSYCQAKCPSCARTDEETGEMVPWLKPTHMKTSIFEKIVQGAQQNTVFQFCGELGDPMMHPDINKFVDLTLEHGHSLEINTNGGLRQPAWYEHYANPEDTSRLRIMFGIDGMDEETNQKYRIAVNWQRAMDNMKAWSTAGGRGEWHFIIFEWNWQQIPHAIEFSEQIDYPVFFKINNRPYGRLSEHQRDQVHNLIDQYQGNFAP
jgi:hypothetical protein